MTVQLALHTINTQIDRAKDTLGKTRWQSLSYPQRRRLVDAMTTNTLSDKELLKEYRRISKEAEINA